MGSIRATNAVPSSLSSIGTGPGSTHVARVDAQEAVARKRWQLAFVAGVGMIVAVLMTGTLLVWPLIDKSTAYSHFPVLAHNLLRGDLTVDALPDIHPDVVAFHGHKYLPFGPLPALILVPFLSLIDLGMRLVWVGHLVTLVNAWLFYRVLKRIDIGTEQLKWSMLLFFGGTVYLNLAFEGSGWGLSQMITVTFIIAAIGEAVAGRRPFVMGLLLAIAGTARFTALFAVPFFLLMIWKDARKDEEPVAWGLVLKKWGMLAAGLAGPVFLLGLYNYARFGNPLDTGYATAALHNTILEAARSHGMFSLAHVPKNLVMMLFQGPVAYPSEDAPILQFPYLQPSVWGMGIFFTSPALIYIFRAKLREPLVRACWLAVICVMVPVITYYGIGWQQVGYRYALDFIPFLIVLAARGMPNPMNGAARVLVIISLAVNLWGCMFLSGLGR
ncbi:MAG: hypothetical protein M3014_00560 [Chloroflexota bacterium]|nr:hypothetical protein [Chloroflexota bacterium]